MNKPPVETDIAKLLETETPKIAIVLGGMKMGEGGVCLRRGSRIEKGLEVKS